MKNRNNIQLWRIPSFFLYSFTMPSHGHYGCLKAPYNINGTIKATNLIKCSIKMATIKQPRYPTQGSLTQANAEMMTAHLLQLSRNRWISFLDWIKNNLPDIFSLIFLLSYQPVSSYAIQWGWGLLPSVPHHHKSITSKPVWQFFWRLKPASALTAISSRL